MAARWDQRVLAAEESFVISGPFRNLIKAYTKRSAKQFHGAIDLKL